MALATSTAANGSVSMEGTTVNLNNSYPTNGDIAAASGFTDLSNWTDSGAGSPRTWTYTTQASVDKDSDGTSGECFIRYTEAPVNGSATVAASTDDC